MFEAKKSILCLLLAQLAFGAEAAPSIDEVEKIRGVRFAFTNSTGDTTVTKGAEIDLQVSVTDNDNIDENDDWKVCTWTRERDGENCRFTYDCEGILCDIGSGDFSIRVECTPQLRDRITFFGEDPNYHNRMCGMKVKNAQAVDDSTWTVNVEECKVTGCGSSTGNGYELRHSLKLTVISA